MKLHCVTTSTIQERQDTLCNTQITCNYHPQSPSFIADSQTRGTSTELRGNKHLRSCIWTKTYNRTGLQIWDVCTKSLCHAHSPNGCFELSVIYSLNIHLAALTKSFIFYYLAAQQSPNSCAPSIFLIIFLTALRLRSGESAQDNERSPARAQSRLRFRRRARTHTTAHTLPDALSAAHLIAGDSSHCEKQCSPVSVLYCYYISSPDFIPVSLSSVLHLSALYRSIPPFICGPPSVPLSCPHCLLWFSAFSVYSETQKAREIITLAQVEPLSKLWPVICVFIMSSVEPCSPASPTPSAQCSTTLPSSDGLIRWCLPKRARADYLQCWCRCLFM